MGKKGPRMLVYAVVGIVAVVAVVFGISNYREQSALAAQARATPQVPPEAAADAAAPVAVSLPRDVNVATTQLLSGRDDVFLLDVRAQNEFDGGHIPGATLIPLPELPARLAEVPRDATVIVACRSGRRSNQAVDLLTGAGFANVHNMTGGMRVWDKAGFAIEN